MKRNRAELKAELLAHAEANVEQFLDWLEKSPAPTLTQIEDSVLHFRQQLGREMAETAIQAQDTVTVVPGPKCPTCGKEMESKSKKGKQVTSRLGDLKLKGTHYYCPHCHTGLFPPG
jgi:YgiT-type zinc finger domain-containing protein